MEMGQWRHVLHTFSSFYFLRVKAFLPTEMALALTDINGFIFFPYLLYIYLVEPRFSAQIRIFWIFYK